MQNTRLKKNTVHELVKVDDLETIGYQKLIINKILKLIKNINKDENSSRYDIRD